MSPRFLLSLALMANGISLPAAPIAAAASSTVTIEIRPADGDGRWTAIYHLPVASARIELARNGPYKRLPGWRSETDGYALVHDDAGREAIQLQPGARPRKSITLSFPVDTTLPVKDYQLFDRFSDGSLALYTGHFHAESADGAALDNRFVLTPRRGEHLVVGGRLHRRRTEWTDPDDEGTFVYFGKLKPVETHDMAAVIDPGAPQWLDRRLDSALPQLFADYARLTGVTLDRRPTVLFSFEPARDRNSTTWKGGTLNGLIQLHIEAPRDAAEDPAMLERFLQFIAHEASHMWNGQMFESREPNQSWMHEGGADAFARRALRRMGILDDAALESRETADLNECLGLIGNESLDDAEKHGNYRALYACGATLGWLTEAAVHRQDPSADLHSFWKALFESAAKHGRRYDEALYLSLLEKQSHDPRVVSFVDDFVHAPMMPDRSARMIAAFNAAGVPLQAKPEAISPQQRRVWGERALSTLMSNDCGGRVSFDRRSGKYALDGNPQCATLKSDIEIDRIEGSSIAKAGDAAYDAVVSRCSSGEAVALEGANAKVVIPCHATLTPRTPWLAVVRQ